MMEQEGDVSFSQPSLVKRKLAWYKITGEPSARGGRVILPHGGAIYGDGDDSMRQEYEFRLSRPVASRRRGQLGGVRAENGDEQSEQPKPFFSMSQSLPPVIYSNSWVGACPSVAATESVRTVGLELRDDEYTAAEHCCTENKQFIEDDWEPPVPLSIELPNSNLQDDIDIWGLNTKQHPLSLSHSKEWSSNSCVEPCDKEDKYHSLSFARFRQPPSVGAGLQNMGNTCFINAILQCITHTVPLFEKLRCTEHFIPCLYDKDDFCSFCALKEHIEESVQSSGSALMPAKFKDNLSKLSSDFQPGRQEDAHEFLRCLLDNLHKCTLDPKSKGKVSSLDEQSIVTQVFGGRLKSQLTCCDCGHCSETFEPFLDLSLGIDQVDDLVDALKLFTKVEHIGDAENKITCESCNVQVCKNKRLVLDKAPDAIAFHLKRFRTFDNFIEKIDKHVTYPSELDLRPFHSNPDSEEELKYDLYGVVEHSGLPNYGHYVCTIRSSPSTWHLMNDSHVDPITGTNALHQEAYILFYVRQSISPWFSSLLEEALRAETSGASPVSVLENIDADCSTSSGEGTNSGSGTKFEKDEMNKASLLSKEPSNRYSIGSLNIMDKKENISRCRLPLQDATVRCVPSAFEITNLEKPSTPRRLFSDNEKMNVFEYEDLDDDDTSLVPPSKLSCQQKIKAKAASASKSVKGSCLDKNASRLMRNMTSARRKGLTDCFNAASDQLYSRSPPSDPVCKRKRKMIIQY